MTTANEIYARRLEQMTAGPESETRASLAQPDDFTVRFFGGGGERAAGVTVNETTAMSASAVFACVRNLAEDEAKLPFPTYEKLQPRGKKRRTDLPTYRLLEDSPNPEMTAFSFRQSVTASAVLFGGGYAEIERSNSGVPVNLWPIEPWRVRIERIGDKGRTLVFKVDSSTILQSTDVLYIPGFSLSGIVGYMVAQTGRDSLGLTLAAQKFAANFFGNGTRYSGILSHPGKLSPEAHKRLKDSMEEQAGVQNSHKMKILEEGMKWDKTSADPEEAQMIETRQFQVEDVARWFRMPTHKIGHLLRATGWSTLEATNADYVIDTLLPWFVKWEQECKRKLISPTQPEIFCEHLVEGLLRGDSAARADLYTKLWGIGVWSQNDILEMENHNPIEGGDEHYVPLNFVPSRLAVAAAEAKLVAPTPAPAVADQSTPDNAAQRSIIIESHRPIIEDACARIVRREVEVLRKKGKTIEAVDSFYADHAGYVRTALKPAISACLGVICAMEKREIPDFEACFSAILDGSEARRLVNQGSELSVAMDKWEAEKPKSLTENVICSISSIICKGKSHE